MAKLTCIKQNIFAGNTGPSGVLLAFGSFKSGTGAVFSNNLESIATAAWSGGLYEARNPSLRSLVIEDLNSVLYSITRQIYYLQSDFFPELSSLTTYYQGSLASKKETDTNDSFIYVCNTDDTTNKAFATEFWRPMFTKNYVSVTGGSGTSNSFTKDNMYVDVQYPHYCTGNNSWTLPSVDATVWGKRIHLILESYLTTTQNFYQSMDDLGAVTVNAYDTVVVSFLAIKSVGWKFGYQTFVNYKTVLRFDDPEQSLSNANGFSSYSAYSKFRLYDGKEER